MVRYVVIGDGIAGATAAETLRKNSEESEIIVFTEETEPLYNRIMLKTYMKGRLPRQYTRMHDEKWYRKRDIELFLDTKISNINQDSKIVETSDGEEYSYDKLLIATGGSPKTYPLDKNYDNVNYMWTMEDAEKIKNDAETSEKAVVIGGGLLGIDLAVAYAENDCNVNYLIRGNSWWQRGLSKEGAEIIHRKLEEKGINIMTNTEAETFETSNSEVNSVKTNNGKELECDSVAIAIGQKPNSDIVDVEKGKFDMIKADEYLQTSNPDIYAAGNMVQYSSPIFGEATVNGSWDHSEAMGECAADNMTGEDRPFRFINTYGVGHFDVQFLAIGDRSGETVERKYSENEYRRLFFKDNRLVGAVLIGYTDKQEDIKKAIQDKESITDKNRFLSK